MNASKVKLCLMILLSLCSFVAIAQQSNSKTLFTAGHAGAFIGGLYDGYYPYSRLKQHGDFGLGAPDKLDGEVLMLNGRIYQTQAGGKTFEVKDAALTPFAVVNFFKADKSFTVSMPMSKDKLYACLDSLMPNQNTIYAIRIRGKYSFVKTRAFPPVTKAPYMPLAQMLPLQHFFSFNNAEGYLVGYRIPAYMEGPNISGYHFHYLSENHQNGGHLIDLLTGGVTIEICQLNGFTVDLPQTQAFKNFDFKQDRREEVKQVENGKKN
jgi:acetolactate decarboxylase